MRIVHLGNCGFSKFSFSLELPCWFFLKSSSSFDSFATNSLISRIAADSSVSSCPDNNSYPASFLALLRCRRCLSYDILSVNFKCTVEYNLCQSRFFKHCHDIFVLIVVFFSGMVARHLLSLSDYV